VPLLVYTSTQSCLLPVTSCGQPIALGTGSGTSVSTAILLGGGVGGGRYAMGVRYRRLSVRSAVVAQQSICWWYSSARLGAF